MYLFERLGSLKISEDCFNDIISLVEDELHDLKAERRHYTNKTKRLNAELKQARKDYFKSELDATSKGLDYSLSINPEEKDKLKNELKDSNTRARTFLDRMQDLDKRHMNSLKKEYELRNEVNKRAEE